jgi:hypothetical protein
MVHPAGAHCPIETDEAALYLGHLAAQAEIAAPGQSRECHLALTWLGSIIAHRGKKYWTMDIDGITGPDRPVQNWRLAAQLEAGPARPIDLARWQWLRSDGREVSSIAQDVIANSPNLDPKSPLDVERRLAELSAIIAINEMPADRWSVAMKDANGTLILIAAHQKRSIASLKRRFLSS